MVIPTEKYQELINELQSKFGNLCVFALVRMDDLVDKWTMMIAFKKPVAKEPKDIFLVARDFVVKKLSPEERNSIARIGIYQVPGNHLIQGLAKYKSGVHFEETTPINGNVVYEAYLVYTDDSPATDVSS